MVFSIPFQRLPTSKVALMHPQGQSVDQKHAMSWGPGHGTDFVCSKWDFIHYILIFYVHILKKVLKWIQPASHECTGCFQASRIWMGTFTVETSMSMCVSPSRAWCQDGATAAGCGEVYGWRLSEALGRWRARVFVERFWLNSSKNGGLIVKSIEKLWFNGLDHHKYGGFSNFKY